MEHDVVIQEEGKACDSYEIENTVDPFGAEQTMPIDEDMNCHPEYEDKKVADEDELGQL